MIVFVHLQSKGIGVSSSRQNDIPGRHSSDGADVAQYVGMIVLVGPYGPAFYLARRQLSGVGQYCPVFVRSVVKDDVHVNRTLCSVVNILKYGRSRNWIRQHVAT